MSCHRPQPAVRHDRQPGLPLRPAAALTAALLVVTMLAGPAPAQHGDMQASDKHKQASDGQAPGKHVPKALKEGVGIEPNPGVQLPLDTTFTNAAGEEVTLGRYLNGEKPVLFTLAYYSCPMLCKYIRQGLVQTQQELEWTAGDEFRVVVLSFNHREDAELARSSKTQDLESLGRPEAEDGWAYLFGSKQNIKKVADTVGFNYKWVEDREMYAHEATLMVLTPDGRVSRYINGIQYDPKTVRLSMVEASDGNVGSVLDQVQLFCFSYDPEKGEYTRDAIKIMRAGGLLTMMLLAGTIGMFIWRARRNKPQTPTSDEPTTAP